MEAECVLDFSCLVVSLAFLCATSPASLAQPGQVPAFDCGGAEDDPGSCSPFGATTQCTRHKPQPTFRRLRRRTQAGQAHARRAQVRKCHAAGRRNGTAKPLICLRSCNKGPIFATETAEIFLWFLPSLPRPACVCLSACLPVCLGLNGALPAHHNCHGLLGVHSQLSACLARLVCQARHPANQEVRYLQIERRRRDPSTWGLQVTAAVA